METLQHYSAASRISAHRAPDPSPEEEPIPEPKPTPVEDPVPDHNPSANAVTCVTPH